MSSIKTLIKTLEPFVSENRKKRIHEILENRTHYIHPVFEEVSDLGNIRAAMRTAESLGIQRLSFTKSKESFSTSTRSSQGSEKWLTIKKYDSTSDVLEKLKTSGMRIISTHLSATKSLKEISTDLPLAVFFGNETNGVSNKVIEASDEVFKVPMLGFTESFNVSVAAALVLSKLTEKCRTQPSYFLSEEEKTRLKARYYFQSVQNAEAILKRMLGNEDGIQSKLFSN